ncbi:MAG: hypothetical protein HQL91_08325 [Magnetococcales bacterium]|nr:hypothetical protein [Magnetococcales bacterium]
MQYALVFNSEVLKKRDFGDDIPPSLAPNKGRWLPIDEDGDPDHDPGIRSVITTTTILSDVVTITKTVADRPLSEVQAELVAMLKQETQAIILAAVPDYVQRNVGIGGIYPEEEEARIRAVITTHRDWCNACEAAILAAGSVAEAAESYQGRHASAS